MHSICVRQHERGHDDEKQKNGKSGGPREKKLSFDFGRLWGLVYCPIVFDRNKIRRQHPETHIGRHPDPERETGIGLGTDDHCNEKARNDEEDEKIKKSVRGEHDGPVRLVVMEGKND